MKSSSKLLIKSPGDEPGLHRIAGPGDAGLRFLEFFILNLNQDKRSHAGSTKDREFTLDFFSGECVVEGTTGSGEQFRFQKVGKRNSAFSGPPEMIYIPAGSNFSIQTKSAARIGVFTAPAKVNMESSPAYISADKTAKLTVGKENWTRDVMTSIGNNVEAERLIVGETLNPPGNWSSAPPHKHDSRTAEDEVPMEEIYYFQIDPPQGFGVMRVYTAPGDGDPFDEALVVENGDTVLIPRGYHPVAAAPGYKVHYTWALAGEERRYGAWSDDPKHSWVKKA